ncbi:unnamed protein product [Anisakis simplex]|uniref:Ovule protein n=1 Tax=Anisakis simplex TaxID=6269 RepID=A0A0M3IZT3_ANISI|nr:unnamed protein product [Anisakis simplex]
MLICQVKVYNLVILSKSIDEANSDVQEMQTSDRPDVVNGDLKQQLLLDELKFYLHQPARNITSEST